jgi:hypothetical protein
MHETKELIMNKTQKEQRVQAELDEYFKCAQAQKCTKSMKQNLYAQISQEKQRSWFRFPARMAFGALSLVFATALIFKASNYQQLPTQNIEQAQIDLQVAMHYINQVSLKSLSAVNTNGIKPGLIKPLARSYASL